MKKVIITILILLTWISLFSTGFSRTDGKNKISLRKPDIIDLVFVNYNNWSYVMRNNGSYMNDGLDNNRGGGEFPRGSGKTIVRAGGFYIGTIKNGIPVVSEVEYNSEFQPGRITNSHVSFDQLTAEDPSLPSQKVYLIDREHRTDWPEDALHDAFGRPALIADAQTWAVFNDLDTSLNQESLKESLDPGLGIQVTLESYAFNGPKIGDVVFMRYILTNKTNSDYTQSYFGVWSDPDVGNDIKNDLVGTDTTRGMEYVYNNTNEGPGNDFSVGFDILQGPVVYTAEIPPRDALRYQNNKKIIRYNPKKNTFVSEAIADDHIALGAVSSVAHLFGSIPTNDVGRYNLMRGADQTIGIMKWGPCGFEDYFMFRGNPLTEQGSCDVAGDNNPIIIDFYGWRTDARTLLNTGPFTIKAGESQEIWVGVIGAKGVDRLDAVGNLWETDDLAQSFFDAGFPAPSPPEVPNLTVTPLDGKTVLTWQNNAEVSEDLAGELLGIRVDSGFSADYVKSDFQGYRVYRSLTGLQDSYELLAQYDKIDSLGTISYRFLNANNNIEISDINLGSNTGLSYSYTDSNLTNGQNYFYSVTAYDAQPYIAGPDSILFDGKYILKPDGLPVSLESSVLSNAVSLVPLKSIASSVKNIKVVPNPFYKYSSFETSLDKLIKFTNLPSSCTIKIFTVAGDLVRTLNHNSASDNDRVNNRPYDESYSPSSDATSIERWDLKTANGRYVASGMYIALVESAEGKRLIKFAIIQ
ncbi:hypothetical protein F9K33_12060 [bacterium]|nr:MAG: hypothetical protein F9K33_12060 [bacterium]